MGPPAGSIATARACVTSGRCGAEAVGSAASTTATAAANHLAQRPGGGRSRPVLGSAPASPSSMTSCVMAHPRARTPH
ncbi:hypothetical protein ACFQY4_35880 [Catellatospora bangladeshensis]|uniref:hypothetical protein n=1 Tax=Catellatospora bangladeshensis TaxID=310355 RepID=UPI003623FB20